MKRVLIISYFFPPVSNMGSHRVLRFVRHLREFAWEPVVLTGATLGWRGEDRRLLDSVPDGVRICRARGVDLTEWWKRVSNNSRTAVATSPSDGTAPLRTHRLTTWLNRWVMVPDKYFPWIRPAAALGVRLVRELGVDAIYSTSDPLSDHLVAHYIARRTGVPWVAEFRDLWVESPYFARGHPTALHRALHARLERRVVAGASRALCLSRGIQDYFARTYPATPSFTLYNCFDPSEYAPAPLGENRFTVLYAGAFYGSRSPEPFLAGFARFVNEQHLEADASRFVIIGGSFDLDLAGMIARYGLTAHVELVGQISHGEALRRMQGATALLLVQSPEDAIHVPGKLFEYMGAGRPIFAVSKPCEVAEMISNNQLGWVAEPDAAAIAAKLAEAYAIWRVRGHAPLATQAAERFGINGTTRQLAAHLEAITCPSR